MQYNQLTKEQLKQELTQLNSKLQEYKALGLKLDMSRGKPAAKQLDLSMPMMGMEVIKSDSGIDVRNYGNLEGVPEAREFFAEIFGCDAKNVIVGGNSSLNLMYAMMEIWWRKGLSDSEKPLQECKNPKFLCPSPGYDRHFTITEDFGIEMIAVPMTKDGPDMDIVEKLVAEDKSIKGMWCIPQYSNPQGYVYSDDTIRRLAEMKTASIDFKIFWDNAYCVHHLVDNPKEVLPILELAIKAGNSQRVLMFCSTSKITFSGAGVGALAACDNNISYLVNRMQPMTISFDKVNQLRHVKFLKNKSVLLEHMKKHADLLNPKFDICDRYFKEELAPCEGLINWFNPQGGYFINFEAMPGTAKRCVEICKETGVVLTPAGAAFPYGNDPQDTHIRIAPTFPPIEELESALKVFTLAVKIAAAEKLAQ